MTTQVRLPTLLSIALAEKHPGTLRVWSTSIKLGKKITPHQVLESDRFKAMRALTYGIGARRRGRKLGQDAAIWRTEDPAQRTVLDAPSFLLGNCKRSWRRGGQNASTQAFWCGSSTYSRGSRAAGSPGRKKSWIAGEYRSGCNSSTNGTALVLRVLSRRRILRTLAETLPG